MRESIGSTVLLTIVMCFIVIYVAFLAIAVNYSISFRVKNNVINLIEQYDGLNSTSQSKISDYLKSISYYQGASYKNVISSSSSIGCTSIENSVLICEHAINSTGAAALKGKSKYYTVKTFVTMNFPIFGNSFNITISGDTKIIYGFN